MEKAKEAFKLACVRNDIDGIKRILDEGDFKVNSPIIKDHPPIHVVLDWMVGDDTDILDLLVVGHGADIKSTGKFCYKCMTVTMVGTPLAHAIAQHRLAATRYLLERGGPCCLQASIASRHVLLKLVGRSLNLELIKLFCEYPDVNLEDRTRIFYAAISSALWPRDDYGLRQNLRSEEFRKNEYINMQTHTNFNAYEVFYQVYNDDNHHAVLDYLLGMGVSEQVFKVPHYPRRVNTRMVYELLLHYGWDIKSTDFQGWTALHHAAHRLADPQLFGLSH